jgi:mannose-6-phosphate isomerase-like protein (cupin superfamily)
LLAVASGSLSHQEGGVVDDFVTVQLQRAPPEPAPDGFEARPLQRLAGGSMTHFTLAPGQVSGAVVHRTVEEIWFVLGGAGEVWRRQGVREEVVPLAEGVSLTIPLGTEFQFRASDSGPLTAVVVTMPPWPGEGEAVSVRGLWQPSSAPPADV